jgi:integrase
LLFFDLDPTFPDMISKYGADIGPIWLVGCGNIEGKMQAEAKKRVVKITKRAVDSAKVEAATYLLRDTEVKGFVLVVTPSGTKSYAIDYRAGSSRGAPKRRYVFGKHGVLTPFKARETAKRLLGAVADGKDPAAARATERRTLGFSELADLYLIEGAAHKKASTLKTDRGRIANHIKPLLGRLQTDRIGRAEIERMRDAVSAGKTAEETKRRGPGCSPTGGKGAAAQCVALVSAIMEFAVARGLRADNPARGVKKAPTRKVERFLSEAEIARLAAALDDEAARTGNPYPAAAIRLLLVTGCRRGEIVRLQWGHVDFEHECLRLPDSKTAKKIVYLNAPARALLQELPRMSGNLYVIAGNRAGLPFVGIDKVWFRVRAAAALAGVRLHDLRHSFASVGAAGGLSLPIIGALLGHKHAATTARYAHLSADPLRAANDAVGARIAAAMRSGSHSAASADVVGLPVRRGEVVR